MSDSTDLSTFLDGLPVDQFAQQVGASPEETRAAVDSLVPALLGGMQANSADPAGAASLTQALAQHDGSLLDSGDVAAVDTADGQKIVGHVFGDHTDGVISALAGTGSANSGLIKRLLPLLAPLVLQWLGASRSGPAAPVARRRAAATSLPTCSGPFSAAPTSPCPGRVRGPGRSAWRRPGRIARRRPALTLRPARTRVG